MNGHDRIMAALTGQKPDRIPILLHNFMMAGRELGVTMTEFRNDPKTIADAFIASVEKYTHDGIVVDIDTAVLAGAVGVPLDFPEDEPARCLSGSLDSLKAVSQLGTPRIEDNRRVQIWLEATRLLCDYFGDEILIRGNCDQCPFSLASMMRTPMEWMMDLLDADNQDSVFGLLEFCTEASIQFIELMAQTGAHALSNGDSPAGPEMISPSMYKTYAFPYEKRVVSAARRTGLPYILHICGDTRLILDSMTSLGVDGLDLDYKTDPQLAHDLLKDKVTFIGNIDPSGVLALGTVELVEQRTRELLELFADTPRFILNSGCAIPSNTPPRNIEAMIAAARSF